MKWRRQRKLRLDAESAVLAVERCEHLRGQLLFVESSSDRVRVVTNILRSSSM